MSTVETVRLTREDFVSWLAKALSGGAAQPVRGGGGAEKPTDVTLAWVREAPDTWPVVCVPRAQIQDLFAFVSTYTKARPFSAFFRVLPLELISVLEPRRQSESNRSPVARCVSGASMAEAWVASAREADRPGNVFPLLLSSLSATLGQVALAGYDEAAFDWALQEWIELRRSPGDIFRRQDVEGASAPWRVVRSAVTKASGPGGSDDDLIMNFVSMALMQGAVQPEMLRHLAPLAGSVDLLALLASSREDRINRFNEVVADLKRRSERGVRAEFLAGLMLAIAGNGSFELLRSAREFDGWLDGAVTWFGFCAALFEEGNILTYGNSAGRRLVRDISRIDNPFTPPSADISSSEFRFLTGNDTLSQIVTRAPRSFDVEILPNVISRVIGATAEHDSRRREETEMLVRTLEEAGYMIGRAREIALGSGRDERQGSLIKPSRRGRSR